MAMRIKSLREAANLTQVQLADSLGVLSTTVSNWETGVALPKTAILPQLAETLRYAPFLSPRMPGRSGCMMILVYCLSKLTLQARLTSQAIPATS